MASEKITSIDQLTKDERAIVVAALGLKYGSVARAVKAESNQAIAEMRIREGEAIAALTNRFR